MIRDPIDIKNSNIWEKTNANRTNSNIIPGNDIVIVMGEKRSGKTSFVKILKSDFDLQGKPTYLVDYNCIKKNQQNTVESIEISSPQLLQVLPFYINSKNCHNVTLVFCVDLTNGVNLINRVNEQFQKVREICKKLIEENKISEIKAYNQNRSKCYHFIQKNQDVEQIRRMPFRSIIVGCKYDLFQKMNVQHKKWISRTLRYIAHVNQSSLLSCSTKNLEIGAEIRNIFTNQLSMNRNSKLTNQKDFNKPFFILSGEDKISQMSLPAFNNSGAFNELKIFEQQLASIFPENRSDEKKISKKQFRYIGIDTLINRNKKQIQKHIQQITNKGQDSLKNTFLRTDNLKILEKQKTERDFSKKETNNIKNEERNQQKIIKRSQKQQETYLDEEEAEDQEYV